MDKNTELSISKSLETEPSLLPYIPELLEDLWALGSSPEPIVEILKPLNLQHPDNKVLDLGCGKGAVSITLAHKFGFNIVGIDACDAFLKEARKKAIEFNVSELCYFELDDIRKFINKAKNFDVVIYASLGNILGSFDECIGYLRQTVHPGGFILVDDGFLNGPSKIKRQGYEHYVSHEDTIKQLTSFDDILLNEIITEEESKSINEKYLKVIKKRANNLTDRIPGLKEPINCYIKNQEIECDILDKNITGAIWLLQRKK
jgi:cyclopropane fatty-acyl-phospholipid synthase-like methyltransferase